MALEASRPASAAARGTVQLLAARAFFMVSGYVITVILARELGPAAYGTYGVVISILLWLEVAGSLGIPRAAARLIPASDKPDELAAATLGMLLAIGFALLALCWIAAPYMAAFFEIENGAAYVRLAVLDLPFYGLYTAYQGSLVGYRRFGAVSRTIVAYSLSKVAGTLALYWIGFSVEAALIVNVLATVGALLYLFPAYRIWVALPSRDLLRKMMQIAAPLAVFIVAMQFIVSVHLWMLKRAGTVAAETIGFYVAALNIAQIPTLVSSGLTSVVLSSVAFALAANDFGLAQRYLRSAGRFVIITLAPVCVLGSLHAQSIMSLIYSETYAGGGVFLAILLAGFGLLALLDTLLHALIGADRHHIASAALVVLIPLALGATIVSIGRWGAVGAAVAFTATLAIGVALAVWAVDRRFQAWPVQAGTVMKVILAVAAVAWVGQQVSTTGLWIVAELALLSLMYLLILAALREIGPDDLRAFAVRRGGRF